MTQSGSDTNELLPLLDEVESNTGEAPAKVLADAGYRSESNLQELEERGIEGFVALGRENGEFAKSPNPARKATCRMAKKMQSRRGRDHYRKRKYLAKPPFGWIKHAMGFDRFHLRGFEKVSHEWTLASLAVNRKRMHRTMEWA